MRPVSWWRGLRFGVSHPDAVLLAAMSFFRVVGRARPLQRAGRENPKRPPARAALLHLVRTVCEHSSACTVAMAGRSLRRANRAFDPTLSTCCPDELHICYDRSCTYIKHEQASRFCLQASLVVYEMRTSSQPKNMKSKQRFEPQRTSKPRGQQWYASGTS